MSKAEQEVIVTVLPDAIQRSLALGELSRSDGNALRIEVAPMLKEGNESLIEAGQKDMTQSQELDLPTAHGSVMLPGEKKGFAAHVISAGHAGPEDTESIPQALLWL